MSEDIEVQEGAVEASECAHGEGCECGDCAECESCSDCSSEAGDEATA